MSLYFYLAAVRNDDDGNYFRVPLDSRNLDYQIYFDKGRDVPTFSEAYTSSNTKQLTLEEAIKLISTLPEFNKYMSDIKL